MRLDTIHQVEVQIHTDGIQKKLTMWLPLHLPESVIIQGGWTGPVLFTCDHAPDQINAKSRTRSIAWISEKHAAIQHIAPHLANVGCLVDDSSPGAVDLFSSMNMNYVHEELSYKQIVFTAANAGRFIHEHELCPRRAFL